MKFIEGKFADCSTYVYAFGYVNDGKPNIAAVKYGLIRECMLKDIENAHTLGYNEGAGRAHIFLWAPLQR